MWLPRQLARPPLSLVLNPLTPLVRVQSALKDFQTSSLTPATPTTEPFASPAPLPHLQSSSVDSSFKTAPRLRNTMEALTAEFKSLAVTSLGDPGQTGVGACHAIFPCRSSPRSDPSLQSERPSELS